MSNPDNRTPTQKKNDSQKTTGRFDTREKLEQQVLWMSSMDNPHPRIAEYCRISTTTVRKIVLASEPCPIAGAALQRERRKDR